MEAAKLERSDLSMLHTFAVWMVGDREAGMMQAAEVVRAAPGAGFVAWTRTLLEALTGTLARGARRTQREEFLGALDDILRTDLTVTAGDHPEVRRDPRRLRVLQWELKRRCLAAVIQGVAPAPRATFILIRILGLSNLEVTRLFDISASSVRVNLGRAEQLLDNYLGARCQHLASANSCRCDSRLGVALAHGFVTWPTHPEETPDLPVYLDAHTSVGSLFGSLPGFASESAVHDALGSAGE